MDYIVTHNQDNNTFSVVVDGHKAYVAYAIEGDKLNILTTQVPSEIGGRGIAGLLVKSTFDYALQQGLKCTSVCSYAQVWLQRHPDYTK